MSRTRHDLVIAQDNATGDVSYWQARDNQSVADRDGVSTADYIHALYGFLRQARAKRVLMIGCGGGTLATMLRRGRQRAHIDIVDIDPLSFAIARRYFHLPADVICHVEDGAAFLRRSGPLYDAIVLDAYAREAIPSHLVRAAFFRLVKSRLAPKGIFLVNLIAADDEDPYPDRICYRLKTVWRRVRLLDADGYEDRNAIAVAGAVGRLTPPRLLMKPRRGGRDIARSLKALDFRRLRP